MDAFAAYQMYVALKMHFTPKSTYNYFTYQGRINANQQSFIKRNDRYQFRKLSKHYDPFNLLVACLSENPKMWIGDIVAEKGDKLFQDWVIRNEALTYNYTQQLELLDPIFKHNFTVPSNSQNGEMPLALWLYVRQKISIETLVILDRLTNCVDIWTNKYQEKGNSPLMFDVLTSKIKKYSGFVEVDIEKMKKITYDFFQRSALLAETNS